jgi:hypothetical protein
MTRWLLSAVSLCWFPLAATALPNEWLAVPGGVAADRACLRGDATA